MNVRWIEKHSIQRSSPGRTALYCFSSTLLCVYWTIYTPTAVASGHGWNFVEAFLAPIIAVTLLFPLVERIALIVKRENIGSLSGFLSARYGHSRPLGALVTLVSTVGIIFFIAQQIKGLSIGWEATIGARAGPEFALAAVSALILTIFAIYMGARRPTFTNHNSTLNYFVATDGALKLATVALIALLCLGYRFANGHYAASTFHLASLRLDGGFFNTLLLLVAVIFCAPQIFHATYVESERAEDVSALRRYLPIYFALAFGCLAITFTLGPPPSSNSMSGDNYLFEAANFFGGSAARALLFALSIFTSLVLTAAAAFSVSLMLAEQISRNPLVQERRRASSAINIGRENMQIRRFAIAFVIVVGAIFSALLDRELVSTVGLLFTSVLVQLVPALVAGVTWRKAHASGAVWGILVGCAVWVVLVAVPMFTGALHHDVLGWHLAVNPATNLFIEQFGLSLLANVMVLIGCSLRAKTRLIDRIQAAAFVDLESSSKRAPVGLPDSKSTIANLKALLTEFLGAQDAVVALKELEVERGGPFRDADPVDAKAAQDVERILSGVLGASLANKIVGWQLINPGSQPAEIIHFLEQTAQAIRLNREMLQATLNNLSQGVCVVDKDFQLVAWNARYTEIFDLGPGTIRVGTSLADIIRLNRSRSGYSEEDTEQYIRRRLRDVRFGIPHIYERNWSIGKTLQVVGLPMSDGRYVTSFTDVKSVQDVIADLRHANEKLEERVRQRTAELMQVNEALRLSTLQAERARASQARFLAAASHDLLQPLHAARIFLGALQERGREQSGSELIQSADVSIETADRLLNALLNLSRLEVGGIRPTVRPVDVDLLLKDLRREFTPVASNRGLTLRIVPTKFWVSSDEDLLRSILQNLIGNAVRYTEEGSILVTCRKRGKDVVFEVRDSGPGIPSESLEHIFEEYVRLPQSRDAGKGLGLGLSIVKRICDILHHEVKVESRVGRGSTFSIFVESTAEHVVPPPTANPIVSLAGLSVLCVEDDRAITRSLEKLFERWGVTATFANSIRSATELSGSWDVVLTDYHFGVGGNGLDLVEQMAGRAQTFALITAEKDEAVLDRANSLGVGVIRKPVAPATLRTFLSRIWLLKTGNN